jgi:hypothetical protein
MTTEFSPPYHVEKTNGGFAIINAKGGHEALYPSRGEADELCRLMNHNAELRNLTDEQITEAAKHAAIEQVRRELHCKPDSSGRYDDEDSHVEVRRLDERGSK